MFIYIYSYIWSGKKEKTKKTNFCLYLQFYSNINIQYICTVFSQISQLYMYGLKQSIYSRKLVVSQSFTLRNNTSTSDPEVLPITQ